MVNQTTKTMLSRTMFAGLLAALRGPRDLSWAERSPATGRAHVRATAGRRAATATRRSGGRVYGMNGERPCARRRRQIAQARAKAARRAARAEVTP